jgi:chromosomal replication initiation ATPase DnaA
MRTERVPSSRIMSALEEIAARHRVSLDAVRGKDRFKCLIAPRRECYVWLRDNGWSLPQIGALFSGRDHTSVMYLLAPEIKDQRKQRGLMVL